MFPFIIIQENKKFLQIIHIFYIISYNYMQKFFVFF